MRLPIQYAFSYPERWAGPLPSLDLAGAARLEFEPPDLERFPCLGLAFRALEGDAGLPIVLNAANEVAVSRFLDGQTFFSSIPDLISRAMDAYETDGPQPVQSLADVRAVDRWAHDFAVRQTGAVESKS
jgi:1-deoxy-D-xylulose-5-phosphate reductoisomerase